MCTIFYDVRAKKETRNRKKVFVLQDIYITLTYKGVMIKIDSFFLFELFVSGKVWCSVRNITSVLQSIL